MLSPSSLEKGPYRVVRDAVGSDIEIDRLTPIKLKQPWHRKLADLKSTDLSEDRASLYEATCFAADNNALEVRSLERSGPTEIEAVKNSRVAVDGKHGAEGCYAAIRLDHGPRISIHIGADHDFEIATRAALSQVITQLRPEALAR